MYEAYQKDPSSVHVSWQALFKSIDGGAKPGAAYQRPPGLVTAGGTVSAPRPLGGDMTKIDHIVEQHLNVQALIRSYQVRGHFLADLDPLGITHKSSDPMSLPGMTLDFYGLKPEDLDRVFKLPSSTHLGGDRSELTLREIFDRLNKVYCSKIGVEFMFINNFPQCDWIRRKFETPGALDLSADEKRLTLKRLIRSTKFEEFLARKWSSEKRFGLEGCEVLIPCLKTIIDTGSAQGVDTFLIGMAHRGRLNVLANVCRKPLDLILTQFNTNLDASDEGSGDVKYHLGMCHERVNRVTGKKVKIVLVANPSHLEAVDPVVLGRALSEQFNRGDKEGRSVMAIMIHGDAAMSGQGVVYESFTLSDLPSYTTHGTMHVVTNNQIGFTTDPRFSRSSPYCTDVARVVNAPIFHVNADAPEAVVNVSRIATEWRKDWSKDCVIDLVGYRRYGHNETDEPGFTQPLMYKNIRQKPNVFKLYSQNLIQANVATQEEIDKEVKSYDAICEEAFANAKTQTSIKNKEWIDSPWDDFFRGKDPMKCQPTAASEETIALIAEKFSEDPKDFNLHNGLKRVLAERRKLVKERVADWAMGEAFAFGSLLLDNVHVRLSGQDVQRGTFSHRHHMLHDQQVDGRTYTALNHLAPGKQAPYVVSNSSLSEFGVLAFEHGYSITSPNALTIWEAQFGDFANGAQTVIDQFISGGQSKWVRQCGMCIFLPHGYEGQGPEHSSARLERYLQLSNDDHEIFPKLDANFEMQQLHEINWFVCNPTTPANVFHLVRRQIKLPFRKPLVMMTPKSLLRHHDARSSFDEFIGESRFQRLIPDKGAALEDPMNVKRILFCSGKVYYEVAQERARNKLQNSIAMTRVEQISPFPYDLVIAELKKFPQAEVCWLQEEHKNMGPWAYVMPRFNTALAALEKSPDWAGGQRRVKYIGRAPSASTAAGNKQKHLFEVRQYTQEALNVQV